MPREDNDFEVLLKLESAFVLAILTSDFIVHFPLRARTRACVRACVLSFFFFLFFFSFLFSSFYRDNIRYSAFGCSARGLTGLLERSLVSRVREFFLLSAICVSILVSVLFDDTRSRSMAHIRCILKGT